MPKEFGTSDFGWDLAIGDVRGTRAWRSYANRLVAVNYDTPWIPGENRAECLRKRPDTFFVNGYSSPMTSFTPNPCSGLEPHCQCGFYAYLRGVNDYLTEYGGSGAYGNLIGGAIRGWGKTVVGTRGFRTERAEILALYVPPMQVQLVNYRTAVSNPTTVAASGGYQTGGYQTMRTVRELRPVPVAELTELQNRLGTAYHVPVFTDWTELLAEFPPTDPEVKKEESD